MTIDEAIRNNTVPSDFEAFKKFFELMGIKYEIPEDNLIYLSGFEVNSSQLIVIKFYEDGRFQEFCPYPEEGLTELKDLREENKVLMQECDRLIKEKGELLKKSEQIAEYKRLLKLAVEDFSFVSKKFINSMDSSCSMFNHIAGCVKGCPMSSSDDYGRCKWRYADEALALIGDNVNGT